MKRSLFKAGIVAGIAAATGVVASASAWAAPVPGAAGSAGSPEVFAASASGAALVLKLEGQTLTGGLSSVSTSSALTTVAQGIGSLTPIANTEDQKVTVQGNGTKSDPTACGTPALPSLPLPLTLGLACSSASADVANGAPTASATGSVASAGLDLNSLLNTVVHANTTLANALKQVLGTLPAIPAAGTTVSNVISQVLNQATSTQTLAVTLGHSTSSVTTAAGAVTSDATANGGEIDIMPQTPGGPLASIVVGSSEAKAVYDRGTGKATPSFDAALVTVTTNNPVTGKQTVTVAPGATTTILAGTPLQSTITVASGSTKTNSDGSVSATADGVSVDLLQGIGASSPTAYDGGLDLAFASATASAGGTPAVAPVAPASFTPKSPPVLPFTGEAPWIPVAGAGALAAAVALYVVRRRLLARAR